MGAGRLPDWTTRRTGLRSVLVPGGGEGDAGRLLVQVVEPYAPESVEEVCGVAAADISAAARILGTAERLVTTVLQGVYQSHQATAAAVQVNNVNLLRGMIGRPGCTVFQMNGQPTAENTRETGADGSLPGYRNWQNDVHVREIADAWNVEILQIPHWAPPTHAMEIFRQCEVGTIRFLWVTATNPLVSLPELQRIRSVLEQDRLFVVVSDAFLTETAQVADVVLPAALWGEKTGCFTNADRTVHLSEKAVEPPGEARSDLEIFCEYARRMDFKDRDGAPLVKWPTPEEPGTPLPPSPGDGCATRAPSLTTSSVGTAASSGRAPTPLRAVPSGCTPTSSFPPSRMSARATGTTSTRALPTSRTNTVPTTRAGVPS